MKKKSRKSMLKPILLILLLIVAAAVVLVGIHVWETKQSEAAVAAQLAEAEEDATEGLTYFEDAWYALREDLELVLVLGIDDFEEDISEEIYRNTQQSDFLMLLILDEENESFSVLHLNRDIMTEITVLGVTGQKAGTTTAQLALAHTYGSGAEDSCRNTVEAVEDLLYGVEIDHYVSLTMDAVAILNDLVGGVTVTVLDDLTSADEELVEGATVTLEGEQALTYVRTRYGLEDSTNLTRMKRQQQYLEALLEQARAAMAEDADFSASALLELSSYIVSDCSATKLSELSGQVAEYEYLAVYEIEGEATVGDEYMEYYVDETALQELVIELFYEEVEVDEE